MELSDLSQSPEPEQCTVVSCGEASDSDAYGGPEHHELRHLSSPKEGRAVPSTSPYTCYLILAATTASLGGILFGYDLGIVSAALIQLRCEFSLTDLAKEWVVASMLVGALVASLTGGFLIDGCGRRRIILVNSGIFIVGSALLAFAPSLAVLILGRLVLGFAISLAAIGETVYIAEIAPSDKRGRLVTINELGIVLGFLLAYSIGYAFVHVHNGWRYMFGMSAIPAILQLFGRLVLPASPRFLIMKGKIDEAKKCLRLLRGYSDVDAEVSEIASSLAAEKIVRLRDLLRCAGSSGRRLLIGGGLVFLQQMSGQPTILYYAPAIFHSLGFSTRGQATLASVILGSVKFICACIALKLLDSVGRRRLLLFGVSGMVVCMLLMSSVITPNLTPPPEAACADSNTTAAGLNSTGNATSDDGLTGSRKWFSLLGLVGYIAGYQFSFGPCTWIVLTEIYPSQLRGRAVALATSLNWATNILITAVFLDLKSAFGLVGLFSIYTAVCVVSVSFIFFLVPETKNRSLEEISEALSSGAFKNPKERWRQLRYSLIHPCRKRVTFLRLDESYTNAVG